MKKTLFSLTIGAGLMYLFDPELGEIRRSMLRDRLAGFSGKMPKTSEAIHEKAEALTAQAESLAERVDEKAAEVIENVGPQSDDNSDSRLADASTNGHNHA